MADKIHSCVYIYFFCLPHGITVIHSAVGMQLCLWLFHVYIFYFFFMVTWNNRYSFRGWYATLLMAISCVYFLFFLYGHME